MNLHSVFFRICCTTLMVLSLLGCQDQQDNTVPRHLIGVWKTTTPRFADRFLEFREHFVIFGTGNGGKTTYAIQKIESAPSGVNSTTYTFHYKDAEGELWTLTVTYNAASRTMQLQHRDAIWEISQ